MVRTISATTAAKRFREVLNDVEHRAETFEVERHGKAIARIGPMEQAAARRVAWKDVLTLLNAGPLPDPEFAADLDEIRRHLEAMPGNPWARATVTCTGRSTRSRRSAYDRAETIERRPIWSRNSAGLASP